MYKKFFLILLLVVFIFSASSVAFGLIERPIKYGDLNGDGEINSIDAAVISRHILQVSTLRDITAADLNGDGVVNSLDYTLLSRYILHEINEFPVEMILPADGEINLGDTITYSGDGISVDGSIVTITEGGKYRIKGTLEDGMIMVDTTKSVELQLVNVNITNSNGPAIYIANASKADIVLSGKASSLADGSVSIYDTEDTKVEGALVSYAPLSIYGGTLNVTGNYDQGIISYSELAINESTVKVISNETDGIHAKGDVSITNSNIEIDAASDGIDSKGEIYVLKSRLNIKAKKHGVTSNEDIKIYDVQEFILNTERDGFNTGGNVLILDSRIYIEANEEGFDIDGDVELKDSADRISVVEITSVGDAFDVSGKMILYKGAFYITSTENDIFDADGGIEIDGSVLRVDAGKHGLTTELDITILDGDIDIVSKRDGINANGDVIIKKEATDVEVERSGKIKIEAGEEGFDIGGSLTLEAGEIDITSFGDVFSVSGDIIIEKGNFNLKSTSGEDDGIDCDGSITISGGTFVIEAGKDAITADLDISIEDGDFNINSGSDAFDVGENLLIENGNFIISAANDGIKGNDVVINGGEIEAASAAETIDGKSSININGGNIKLVSEESSAIYAKEEAEVIINGGYIVAIGTDNFGGEELKGGIQCDPSNFVISGGTLIAVGETNTAPNPELSSQCTVLLGEAGADSTISITSSTGEVLNFTAPKQYKNMLFTSSELILNEEYDVYVDEEHILSFETTSMVIDASGTLE